MTSERKLADLLDRYTRYYNEAVSNPRVRWDDGAFRELCRDLHGELGAHITASKPTPQNHAEPSARPVVRVRMATPREEAELTALGW